MVLAKHLKVSKAWLQPDLLHLPNRLLLLALALVNFLDLKSRYHRRLLLSQLRHIFE